MSKGTVCCRDGECAMPLAPWHGTSGGYNNHGCRCDRCRKAWATYFRKGPGAAVRRRYQAKLIEAGVVLGGSLHGKQRVRPYKPRPYQTSADSGGGSPSGS